MGGPFFLPGVVNVDGGKKLGVGNRGGGAREIFFLNDGGKSLFSGVNMCSG